MYRLSVSLIAVYSLLSGIAMSDEPADESDSAGKDADAASARACFSIRQARRIDALNERFIYLEASGTQNFLLTMTAICPGLYGVSGIRIGNQRQDQVCTGDRVMVSYRSVPNAVRMVCWIDDVTAVANREAAESIAKSLMPPAARQ
jgi:hypothetical protein